MAGSTFWILVVSAVGLAISLYGISLLIRNLSAANRAAAAAEDAAKTARDGNITQFKPYLRITKVIVDDPSEEDDVYSSLVRIYIKNTGQTPAYLVDRWIKHDDFRITCNGFGLPGDLKIEEVKVVSKKKGFINPGETNILICDAIFSGDNVLELLEGPHGYSISGSVIFTDISTEAVGPDSDRSWMFRVRKTPISEVERDKPPDEIEYEEFSSVLMDGIDVTKRLMEEIAAERKKEKKQ